MDAPLVLVPDQNDTFLESALATSDTGMINNVANTLSATFQAFPDSQVGGFELGAAGEGAFLASFTLTEGAVLPPGFGIATALAFPFAFLVGGAQQDEGRGADYFNNAPNPVPPPDPVTSTAQLFQQRILGIAAQLTFDPDAQVVWYGTRVAGHFGRRFMYFGIGEILLPAIAAEGGVEAIARGVEPLMRSNPLAGPILHRMKMLRERPELRERAVEVIRARGTKKRRRRAAAPSGEATPAPEGAPPAPKKDPKG